MVMSIRQVPSEILRLIVENLDPDDLFHLAMCGSHFHHLIRDQGVCRIALQNAKFSPEYEDAHISRDFARALRRYVKRRDAILTATPFQVVRVAQEALHFVYANEALCYTTKKNSQYQLRILRLQGSVSHEIVLEIPGLLQIAPMQDFVENEPYQLRPLYHANDVVSCLFTPSRRRAACSRLLICDLDPNRMRISSAHHLPSKNDIFVRNNRQYLYYGTRSEINEDGEKCWALRGFSLEDNAWIPQKLVLWDMDGVEMGSTVCFEIFGDYLYGVSSQDYLGAGDSGRAGDSGCAGDSGLASPDSYYYAFRFRLGNHSTTQVLPKSALWRRCATEGPIDDRWSSLKLERDQRSGKIFISETRREWLSTNSQSQRTCYRRELQFPDYEDHIEGYVNSHEPVENGCSGAMPNRERIRHPGDGGSSPTPFTLQESPIRSFNTACEAFVDLVRSPTAGDPTAKKLRLRVRRARRDSGPAQDEPNCRSDEIDHHTRLWPDEEDSTVPNPTLSRIHQILNPLEDADEIDWAIDERFLVYSARVSNRQNDGLKNGSITLISFDPGLQLHLSNPYHTLTTLSEHPKAGFPSGTAEGNETTSPCIVGDAPAAEPRTPPVGQSKTDIRILEWGAVAHKQSADYMEDSGISLARGCDFFAACDWPVQHRRSAATGHSRDTNP